MEHEEGNVTNGQRSGVYEEEKGSESEKGRYICLTGARTGEVFRISVPGGTELICIDTDTDLD